MPVEINDGDEISRCIIFDRFFDENAHTDELLWLFGQAQADGAAHESAVLRRLAPEVGDVHRIGCGIAAAQNERLGEPDPGPERRYYCGFRSASYASLPKGGLDYTIRYTNIPEGGQEAHVDVAFTITATGKNARAQRRTDAGLALAEQFGPPEPYRCACDEQDNQHPFDILGPECLVSRLRDRWPNLHFGPHISNDQATKEEQLKLPGSNPNGSL